MDTRSEALQRLLAHEPWVRALARSLVHDRPRAEDLAQNAWLAALEQGGEGKRSPRQWIAGVLRNLARQERRGAGRREAHERAIRGQGENPPADEVCAALELSRRLSAAVEALDEPYRSTIFRRYYEGLEPRRIAELDRVPLKTVKTRLARGLEKLRERLDREHHGDRAAWIAASLPLLRETKTPLLLGGILMNLKLACVAAGIVLLAAWALHGSGSAGVPGKPKLQVEPALSALDSTAESAATTRSAAREEAPAVAAAVCPFPHLKIELAGRVVDPHGLALAGVRLVLMMPDQALETRRPGASCASFETVALSGEDGSFRIQPRRAENVLMGECSGFVTLLACDSWSTDGSKELLVVMAPTTDVAGLVVDGEDRPIAGAEVRVVAGEEFRSALGIPSDTAVEVPWKTRSDAAGRFVLEGVACAESLALAAAHPSHSEASIALPANARRDLRIVLAGREVKLLAGEVRDCDDLPVADAFVGMGQMSTRSDANGRFQIELDPLFPGMQERLHSKVLGAVKPGQRPARMDEPESGWPAFVTLVLAGEPLSIRGKLLDAQGRPQPGIEVRAVDEHLLGMVAGSVGEFYYPRTLEGLARRSDERETPAFSNRAGEFVLRGLLDESYVLRAFDPRTLRTVESGPLRAGLQSAELRFPADSGSERVAGRVLALDGAPLAGVMLVPSRRQLQGEMRQTDAAGRFDFGSMVTESLEFQVMGAGLQTLVGWKAPEGGKFAELEVRVARRCQLQVDLADRSTLADSVLVQDALGRKLELWIEVRSVSSFQLAQPIRAGKSDVLLVAENAVLVVLQKNGVEVERQPVKLDPAGLVTLRF